MKVIVFRLGHRISRDHRISTHCGLVSRALGADGIIYSGDPDQAILDSVTRVREDWGGKFSVAYEKSWKKVVKDYRRKGYVIVHLTMYGMPVQKKLIGLRKKAKLLVVVGGEKVPWEMYQMADYNVSVTSQPHSEIAALAVFLDRIFCSKELDKKFTRAKKTVIPQERGKKVIGK
ncbi:MAG: tRNA (cytidine(56)-2'-O)-methyltransferase [Candidatus Aenigmatarchaeota archaeon]